MFSLKVTIYQIDLLKILNRNSYKLTDIYYNDVALLVEEKNNLSLEKPLTLNVKKQIKTKSMIVLRRKKKASGRRFDLFSTDYISSFEIKIFLEDTNQEKKKDCFLEYRNNMFETISFNNDESLCFNYETKDFDSDLNFKKKNEEITFEFIRKQFEDLKMSCINEINSSFLTLSENKKEKFSEVIKDLEMNLKKITINFDLIENFENFSLDE